MKGAPILVESRVESREYETKEGQKRTVVELVVSQAHFCGKKEETQTESRPMQASFDVLTGDDSELPF